MNIPSSNKQRIVIIGAGFAGIEIARKLDISNFQVVLIDKNNYHTFQPLLYQVATAGLEADSIAYGIREIAQKFNRNNFFFRMAEVNNISPEENIVYTNIGEISYDYLIISTGSRTNFYGNQNVEKYSMPMKSVVQALDLRHVILQNFEKAILVSDLEEQNRLINFVIVGGGPTGVELAGALAELKNHVLPLDYPDLDIRKMNIHIMDATERLLTGMSKNAGDKAALYLEELGVQIWYNTIVKDYDGKRVTTNHRGFETKTMIWAAGVKGAVINGIKEESVERSRFLVDEFNTILGYENIYAVGDVALLRSKKSPNGHPMVAQVAIQQGELLAKNLNKSFFKNQKMTAFVYKDKGSMATVGRNKAVVDLPNFKFQGFFAWIVWMFIHLVSLVGFRNKVVTLANWIIQYFSYDRHVRLIIRPFKQPEPLTEILEEKK